MLTKHNLFFTLILLPLAWAGLSVPPAQADGEKHLRENAITKAVQKTRRAVVAIKTTRIVRREWYDFLRGTRGFGGPMERQGGLGSGAIFHPDGYVVTNAHVVQRASKIFVILTDEDGEEQERPARALAVDIPNDLAILQLVDAEGPLRYPSLPLGRSDDLMIGETVLAVGNPFQLGITVTTGIVSGLNRKLELGSHHFDDFIQVDAAINPGNSGGPLIDVTGRWIGVNTAIYNRATGAEGIGFAIPMDRVRSLIAAAFKRRLVNGHWIGIDFELGADEKALVQFVYEKGPARNSGLREKDVVIGVNGRSTPTLYDVRVAMMDAPLTGPIMLEVKRDGRALAKPVSVGQERVPTARLSARHLGFVGEDVDDVEGVVIMRLRADGPAKSIKLSPQDIVVGLGPWKIKNSDDLLRFLQFVKEGDLVDVRIKRITRGVRGSAQTRNLKGTLKAQ